MQMLSFRTRRIGTCTTVTKGMRDAHARYIMLAKGRSSTLVIAE